MWTGYCWIGLSKVETDFGFGLSIQLFHFNQNPKNQIFNQEIKISMCIMLQQ